MAQDLRVLIAQRNATVGDIDGNLAIARSVLAENRNSTDLIVFPEAFLIGYQADDLVFNAAYLEAARIALDKLGSDVVAADGPAILIGTAIEGDKLPFNAAVLLYPNGQRRTARKVDLPNTGPFSELRTFQSGQMRDPFPLNGYRIGVAICEEAWHQPVCGRLAAENADLLIVLNGSPYVREKHFEDRLPIMRRRVRETRLPLIYCNLVGGQDELVYDGASFVLDSRGNVSLQMPAFEECERLVRVKKQRDDTTIEATPDHASDAYPSQIETDWRASVLATRDYVEKNQMPGIILGVSGGLDSAVAAAIAVDAVGRDRVRGLTMPSRITSEDSLSDAHATADTLGIRLDSVAIGELTAQTTALVAPAFADGLNPITLENIQPRLRMTLIMAFANQTGDLPITTGNKSELSLGYTTANGDMAGFWNPIKDWYKTEVRERILHRNALWIPGCYGNQDDPVVPGRVIEKPPSAELSEGQTDAAALGPYDVIDPALRQLIDHDASVAETTRMMARTVVPWLREIGRDADMRFADESHIRFLANLIRRSEYKRAQAAIGPKMSRLSFGRDRRFPITNRFNG